MPAVLVYEEFDQNGEARIVTLNRNKEKQQRVMEQQQHPR